MGDPKIGKEQRGGKYKFDFVSIEADGKIVLEKTGGVLQEIQFEGAEKLGQWVTEARSKSAELPAEHFLLLFLKQHFEAMGLAGEEQLQKVMKLMEDRFSDADRRAMQEKWDHEQPYLDEIYGQTGIKRPEPEQQEAAA